MIVHQRRTALILKSLLHAYKVSILLYEHSSHAYLQGTHCLSIHLQCMPRYWGVYWQSRAPDTGKCSKGANRQLVFGLSQPTFQWDSPIIDPKYVPCIYGRFMYRTILQIFTRRPEAPSRRQVDFKDCPNRAVVIVP